MGQPRCTRRLGELGEIGMTAKNLTPKKVTRLKMQRGKRQLKVVNEKYSRTSLGTHPPLCRSRSKRLTSLINLQGSRRAQVPSGSNRIRRQPAAPVVRTS